MPIDPTLLQRIQSNDPTLKSTLDLSKQDLNADDIKQLVEALKTNTFITYLDVSECKLGD